MHLTQSQFSLWMGQKLNPDVPLYNMAHVFTIFGIVEVENFKNAFPGHYQTRLANSHQLQRTLSPHIFLFSANFRKHSF